MNSFSMKKNAEASKQVKFEGAISEECGWIRPSHLNSFNFSKVGFGARDGAILLLFC